ncbi:Cas10/Cmr2 second palm domain-containing protein [Haliscomenobacter hydrossis]|uniref:GGDEF domain-containing protein n=1 Tax=Haliscomenobacter hydrossis (strain ATCC 27775 / DSM 1100 / LMG 10767 / O) TaxID=760192 RepID=F4L836_HALH1|nr:type III-B CRISPR-associated protein Cas10/Cmr2 [Haliscomenobacter hydrossis]AEE54544.1 hypothetical protein Halhy_6729 [Haliscomenobacter hydrossis DSM 1100]
MPIYTGITIGPIDRTIENARFTRELWASSYFFSYLMHQLALKLSALSDCQVILPYLDRPAPDDAPLVEAGPPVEAEPMAKTGAGLYPDRIILHHTGAAPDIQSIRNAAKEVIKGVAAKIALHLKHHQEQSAPSQDEVQKQLFQFLQLNAQQVDIPSGQNVILTISPFLDAIELAPKMPDIAPASNHLAHFFNLVNARTKKDTSFLIQDGFGQGKRFDSLIEIAARELRDSKPTVFDDLIAKHFKAANIGDDQAEAELIADLEASFGDKFLHLHKHLAIVHADGDYLGKVLECIGEEPGQIEVFSKFMFNFAQDAAQLISSYGGVPVYIGGDDLFFMAPVRRIASDDAGKKTPGTSPHLFKLLDVLDKKFQEHYEKFRQNYPQQLKKLEEQPALSFGVSIAHYKTPLYESIRMSRDALKAAKKATDKHTLALRLGTHSGRMLSIELPMGNHPPLWESFLHTLSEYLVIGNKGDEASFGNALARRLVLLDPLFEYMRYQREWSLRLVFENLIKQNAQFLGQGQAFIQYLELLYSEECRKVYPKLQPSALVLALVRLIHFYNRSNQR